MRVFDDGVRADQSSKPFNNEKDTSLSFLKPFIVF